MRCVKLQHDLVFLEEDIKGCVSYSNFGKEMRCVMCLEAIGTD